MKTGFKRMLGILLSITILFSVCISISGCDNQKDQTQETSAAAQAITATVTEFDQFGDAMLEITEIDLAYGDSVDISFSGGYEMIDIPYYPDFFGSRGSAILTDHFDHICVAGIGCSFANNSGIKAGETVSIKIHEECKFKNEYEAYNINDAVTQAESQSDEAFLNAREITAGNIQPKRLYRGSSPFDEKYGRVDLMDQYLSDHSINCILDLSDTQEKLDAYENLPDYTASMITEGKVIPCSIGVDYLDPEAMKAIGAGLAAMSQMDGPYLIQCSLGRDRTGVICAVIEALCGASYQEIVDDYMLSYDMLHSIDMDPASLQYRLFKQRIDEQLEAIFEIEIDQLPESDLQATAVDYLTRCGRDEEQINRLIRQLTETD